MGEDFGHNHNDLCDDLKNVRDRSKLPFPKENIVWYYSSDMSYLGIWAIGGNDFNKEVEQIMKSETMEHTIDKVVVVTDHDDATAENGRFFEIRKKILGTLKLDSELCEYWNYNQWVNLDLI